MSSTHIFFIVYLIVYFSAGLSPSQITSRLVCLEVSVGLAFVVGVSHCPKIVAIT